MAHARLGPSNPRWPHCPGSIREEEPYADNSSAAAIDGTGSHLFLESCIKYKLDAVHYDRETIGIGHEDKPEGWFVEPDRIARVQVAIDYINRKVEHLQVAYPDCNVSVDAESKSNPGKTFGRTDWWGTCDVTVTVITNTGVVKFIEVIDYKDGRMYVDVNNNSQLISYLWGKAAGQVDCDVLTMTIIQPKIESNPIRTELITPVELATRAFNLNVAATATDAIDAPLKSGKWCRWCKHKPNCNAEGEQYNEVIKIMGNGLIEKVHTTLKTMSVDDLSSILNAEKAFIDAFAKAKKEAEDRIIAGQFVPGYFMGKGNSKNTWNLDEKTIVKKLRGMKVPAIVVQPVKLISPAQARKLDCLSDQQKVNLEKFISTVDGKPAIKQGVGKTAEELFMGSTLPIKKRVSFL